MFDICVSDEYKEICKENYCKKCFTLNQTEDGGNDGRIDVMTPFLELLFSTQCIQDATIKSIIFLIANDSFIEPTYVSSIRYDHNIFILVLRHTEIQIFPYLFQKIEELWNEIERKKDKKLIVKLCYKMHWLFTTTTPFFRGSAAVAKILLNACLIKCGLAPVMESPAFHAHSDWIALLSPRFDNYYDRIQKGDVFIDKVKNVKNVKKNDAIEHRFGKNKKSVRKNKKSVRKNKK